MIIEDDSEIKKKPEFDEELFRRMKEEMLAQEALAREEELLKSQKKHDIALTNIRVVEEPFH